MILNRSTRTYLTSPVCQKKASKSEHWPSRVALFAARLPGAYFEMAFKDHTGMQSGIAAKTLNRSGKSIGRQLRLRQLGELEGW